MMKRVANALGWESVRPVCHALIGAVVLSGAASAQELEWARLDGNYTSGGTTHLDLAATPDGGCVAIGRYLRGGPTFGAGEIGETTLPYEQHGAYLARYAPDGTLVWATRIFGGTRVDPRDVAVAGDGSIAVASVVWTAGALVVDGRDAPASSVTADRKDPVLTRYSMDGEFQWLRSPDPEQNSWARHVLGVAGLPDGSFVMTGNWRGSLGFGNLTLQSEDAVGTPTPALPWPQSNSLRGDNLYVARYLPDGSLAYANQVRGSIVAQGKSMDSLPDGSVIISGSYWDEPGDPLFSAGFGLGENTPNVLNHGGGWHTFAAKFAPDGTHVWSRSVLAGTSNAVILDIDVRPDGSVAWAGHDYFYQPITVGIGQAEEVVLSTSGRSPFLVKLDGQGFVEWARLVAISGDVVVGGVTWTPDGSVAVAGSIASGPTTFDLGGPAETVLGIASASHSYLAVFDGLGGLTWVDEVVAPENFQSSANYGISVAASPLGGLNLGGGVVGDVIFGAGSPQETFFRARRESFLAQYSAGVLPPTLTVPADISASCEAGFASVSFGLQVAGALPPGTELSVVDQGQGAALLVEPALDGTTTAGPFSFPLGASTVEASLIHDGQVLVSESFTITVGDDTPPLLEGTGSKTLECSGPSNTLYRSALGITATDECDPNPTLTFDPIAVGMGTTSVTVTATDHSGNSTTGSMTVTVVDTMPPIFEEVPIEPIGLECIDSAGATLTFTVTAADPCGPVAISCEDQEGNEVEPGGTYLPLGTHTITCTVTDIGGNAATHAFEVVVYDLAPPSVTITAPLDGSITAVTTATLMADIVETSVTSVTSTPAGIDASVAPGGGTVAGTVPLEQEGPNLLVITAVDCSGKQAANSVTVIRDTLVPGVTVVSPSNGSVVGASPIEVALDITDATSTTTVSGADSVDRPAGGGSLVVTAHLAEGSNVVTGTVTDAAGNTTTFSVAVTLDLTAPAVTIDSPGTGACFGPGEELLPVTATVDDLTATMLSSTPSGLEGSLPAGGGIQAGVVTLTEGSNTITLTAVDQAGIAGSDSIVVVLDTTPPSVQLTSPLSGAISGEVDLFAEAADPVPGSGLEFVQLEVDGTPFALVTESPFGAVFDTLTLADGPHVFTATAVDKKGNVASSSVTAVVDNTAPEITFLAPSEGAYLAGLVAVEGEASDAGAGVVEVQLLAGGATPTVDPSTTLATPTASVSLTGFEDTIARPDGALIFTATAIDAAGNLAVAEVTIQVDNSAPSKVLSSPSDGENVSGTVTLAASAEDANLDSIQILVDGSLVTESSTSPLEVEFDTTSILDGAATVAVVVRDLAGNESVCEVTMVVDNIGVKLRPAALQLEWSNKKGKGSQDDDDHFVHVKLTGPNLGLLLPVEQRDFHLRVPGGSPVPAQSGWSGDDQIQGTGDDAHLRVRFSRNELANVLRATLPPQGGGKPRRVPVEVVASGKVIGVAQLKVVH